MAEIKSSGGGVGSVDTSSYPKFQNQSFLDVADKFQGLEQGAVNLQQSKLKQINDQYNLINSELAAFANDPNATKEQVAARIGNFTKMFNLKPDVTNDLMRELQMAPSAQAYAKGALVKTMVTQEKINTLYGRNGFYRGDQADVPIVESPFFGARATGLPIQRQTPPGQEVVDTRETLPDGSPNPNYGARSLQGPTNPVLPQGAVPANTGIPGQYVPNAATARPQLPVAQPSNVNQVRTQRITPDQSINLTGEGKTITGVDVQDAPATFAQRFPGPSGPSVGMSPLFEEGKKAYTQDQLASGAKMLAAKPAIQALPLMQTPGFLSGPLTDQFTKVVAGLKSTGLIDIQDTNDPTAIRQEVAKKLYQYVSNSPVGQRSDAAQTLREASSPNPNVQILPALVKLTKDAVALDRVEALMPNVFKGKDYQNYLKHKGTFPQSIDEKALTLDLETEEKSRSLVDDMAKKLKSSNARERNSAEKFFKTLKMAKDQGFY